MGDARLGILISADTAQAQQGLNKLNESAEKAGAGLTHLAAESKKASSVFVQLPPQLDNVATSAGNTTSKLSQLQKQVSFFGGGLTSFTNNFSRLPAAIGGVNQPLARYDDLSRRARQTTLDFSRVIQDAPYAILSRNIGAVANNIDQLVPSFQRTIGSAGSFTGGLKAIGRSLLGAGGIGLGISIVTAGLTLFGDKLFGASKAAKEMDEATQKLAQDLTLSAAKLTVLVGVVQNVNSSYDDKQKALQAINQEYGKYLSNLNGEKVTLENIGKAYDVIIDNLLRQAVVKGLQEQIAKSVEETAAKVVELQIAEEKRRIESGKTKATITQGLSTEASLRNAIKQRDAVITDATRSQEEFTAATTSAFEAENTYEKQVQRATDALKRQLEPLLNLTTNFEDLDIKLDKIKDKKIDISIKIPDTGIIPELQTKIPVVIEVKEFVPVSNETIGKLSSLFRDFTVPVVFEFDPDAREKMEAFNTQLAISRTLADTLTSSFESVYSAILEGKNAIQSFVQAFASSLTQLISKLLAAATAAALLQAILPGNTLTSLFGGKGFMNIFKSIAGFRAGGGPVTAGRKYVVGEIEPELFVPNVSGQIIPFSALDEILGQMRIPAFNSIGSTTSNVRSANIPGMLQTLNVVVSGRLSGQDMLLSNARTNRYNGRN